MAQNTHNNTQIDGRNVKSVSDDLLSSIYSKKKEFLLAIEQAISTPSTYNEIISDFDGLTNRSDSMFKGNVSTVSSIESVKNYTKDLQKLKPFFSDETLEWSEVVLVFFLVFLIVITVIGKFT